MAGREKLGNLIFVINCNLQATDEVGAWQWVSGAGRCLSRSGLGDLKRWFGGASGTLCWPKIESGPTATTYGRSLRRQHKITNTMAGLIPVGISSVEVSGNSRSWLQISPMTLCTSTAVATILTKSMQPMLRRLRTNVRL
jgi:hypothetical protein